MIFAEGLAGVPVEGEGRPHDPYNGAVVAVVAQKLVELVIVARERGLARAAQAEGEVVVAARVRSAVLRCGQTAEAVGVDENALLAVFRASAGDEIAGAGCGGTRARTRCRLPRRPRNPCGNRGRASIALRSSDTPDKWTWRGSPPGPRNPSARARASHRARRRGGGA